jgi:TolB protein
MKNLLIILIIFFSITVSCKRDEQELKIVYQHEYVASNYQIITMNEDGSEKKPVTETSSSSISPSWSADGKKIVFTSNKDGQYKIYIMNSNGSDTIKLSDSLAYSPTWSPDSNKIVFYYTDADQEIYIINSNGTGLIKLTDNALNDILPVWFPDSKKIAFLQTNDIYTMNYDGSNVVQITSAASINSLSVSPDGQKIAYESGGYIWTINSDGTNPVNITLTYSSGTRPSWSPDGEKILFATTTYPREICIINSDGTDFKYLTNDSWDDDYPCFQFKPK